jgi:hypothetical protein
LGINSLRSENAQLRKQASELETQVKRSASLGADALVATVALEKFFNAKFVAMHSQYTPLLNTINSFRAAADQHHRDTDRQHGEFYEQLAELTKLIEPNAARLRAPRRSPSQDWDEVQRQNLKQFEDEAR